MDESRSTLYAEFRFVNAYDFLRYLASGTSIFILQQLSANILEVHLPWYRFSLVKMSGEIFYFVRHWLRRDFLSNL
jgi:hypothetical protein